MHAKSKRAYLITASCGKRTVGPYSATSAAERDNVKRQLRRSYPRCRVATQTISIRPGGDRGLRGLKGIGVLAGLGALIVALR